MTDNLKSEDVQALIDLISSDPELICSDDFWRDPEVDDDEFLKLGRSLKAEIVDYYSIPEHINRKADNEVEVVVPLPRMS